MKKTISLFFIVAAFTCAIFAQPSPIPKAQPPQSSDTKPLPQDAASAEQLRKLFEVIGIEKQMRSLVTSLADNMQQMLPAAGELTEKQKAEMTKLQTELFGKMMSPEFINTYLDMMVPVYQLHFTRSDVDQIIAFYSSPAGQKFVNEQPLIVQEVFPKVMPMMQEHMQKVMKETNFEQRMKAILAEDDKPEGKPK